MFIRSFCRSRLISQSTLAAFCLGRCPPAAYGFGASAKGFNVLTNSFLVLRLLRLFHHRARAGISAAFAVAAILEKSAQFFGGHFRWRKIF
jgi:hypothetical protein